jgi:hypothetical protein
LYCAFNYIGDWHNSPGEIIRVKRKLDTLLFSYRLLLNPKTLEAYNLLMAAAFETGRGRGQAVRLRANVEMYRAELSDWREEYAEMFVSSDKRLKRVEFNRLYDDFMVQFFDDVGLRKAVR